ncbi:Calcium-binding ef-hand protein [Thalictrum thalictroides]|uniref:Calcium-binding ef-hand protein n=1 Tax=Thalictrum thalictroides TaxID=46969 RepID=A0A7J6VU89_THATH|nr:Calcium-binding ef-hand protein [Thalictrum thalictroides]
MAWNPNSYSSGQYSNGGYWESQTRLTTISYGSPPSPQRSPSPPYGQTVSYEKKYHNSKYQTNGMGMGTLTYAQEGMFGELLPSSFPPGTDPKLVSCFQNVDRDKNGFIDEKELKLALTTYSSTFSLRTIRLIMYAFAKTNTKVIGPKEFVAVYYGIQQWKAMFQKFDRDRNGRIDMSEMREALRNLGYPVTECVLDLLMAKFDKDGGNYTSIGFDGFIECCITIKGLTDKFKEKDQMCNGSATFSYETFMMTVLPYVVG